MAVASARGSARPQTSSSPTIAPAGVPTAYTVWLVSTGVPNRRYTSAAYSQTVPDTITPKYPPPISADICGSCSPAARRAGSGLYDPFSLCLKIYFYKTLFLFPLEIILFSLFYNFSRQKPLFFFAIFVFSLSIRDTNTNSSELLYCCPCFVFAPSGQLDYSLVTDLLYSQFYVYPQRFSVDFWWTFILYHRNTLPYDF